MRDAALLLFDLGGVLIENSVFERLSCLVPESIEAQTLRERWLSSSAVRRFELGAISPDQFAEAFLSEWGIRLAREDFLDEFRAWPRGFYPGARKLLLALREKYRVGCLSNSNVLHWERFGGFKDDFDIALSSHRLGAVKPDEGAFIRALDACGEEASAVCFFDDTRENVLAAHRLGIRAFQVEGITALLGLMNTEGFVQL